MILRLSIQPVANRNMTKNHISVKIMDNPIYGIPVFMYEWILMHTRLHARKKPKKGLPSLASLQSILISSI